MPSIYGSSLRSRDILYSQKEIGLEPIAITSPFQEGLEDNSKKDIIDGIVYFRTSNNNKEEAASEKGAPFLVKVKKLFRIFSFVKSLDSLIKEEKPDILHAHATFFCGIAAFKAAKKHGIPYVYEVRSLWEERALQRNKNMLTKLSTSSLRFLETKAMLLADHVVVINQNLYDNIVARGIDKRKVSIIPNAVNSTYIQKLTENLTTSTNSSKKEENFFKSNPITLGYIGTVSPIEGLDLLIKAVEKVNNATGREHFILKIFGNGIMLQELKSFVAKNDFKSTHFMGSLEPQRIPEAYNEIDIIVNPRIKSKLTDSVTPLKPLEAMAYRKLVIGSDVGGIKELVKDKETGLLFEADKPSSLYDLLIFIAQHYPNEITSTIIENGQAFVKKNRSWLSNAKKYKAVYQDILSATSKNKR